MAFEFLFAREEETKWDELHQGDILIRTTTLQDALNHAHSYYAIAADYTHFMVLTQSCDLVFRGAQKARTRYITLAAVRPLTTIIDRLVNKHRFVDWEFPLAVCQKEREAVVKQTLERLVHNTEEGHFFLRRGSHPNINDDLCVFLALSVALRIDHYQACVSSKVAQLDHIFQAKVGWLAGNLYSRIGTPDVEEFEREAEALKQAFYEEAVYSRTAWLTPAQLKHLKKATDGWKKANRGQRLTNAVAQQLVQNVPLNIDLIAQRVVEQLAAEKFIAADAETKARATNLLCSDNGFKNLIKAAL